MGCAKDRVRPPIPLLRRLAIELLILPLLACSSGDVGEQTAESGGSGDRIRGRVTNGDGQPVAGAIVTARSTTRPISVSRLSDSTGIFRLDGLSPGAYELAATHPLQGRHGGQVVESELAQEIELELAGHADPWTAVPASAFLGLLPDGETKRRFILDCTGCHTLDDRVVRSSRDSAARVPGLKSGEEWSEWIRQMIAFAGAGSSFPIMSPSRDAEATADWLTASLGDALPSRPTFEARPLPTGPVRITEFKLPTLAELPHDLLVTADGRVLVTGMLTHRMVLLNPDSGRFDLFEIPVPSANPRALELDPGGAWWVLLGAPQRIARYEPDEERWESWEIGMYPHSIGRTADGRLWFNGHFTVRPELLGSLDPTTGRVTTYEVPTPAMPDGGSTIPYELRIGPDGTVWMSQLRGNRIVRFDPSTETFRTWELPTPYSGPRRFDLDSSGAVWIPEYAANRLARFDPATETFDEFELPIPDALPYVVRVDGRRDRVWIGTAAADALLRFDPAGQRFTVYPLPTRSALIRHIDIDSTTGDVWAAYGPFPPREPKLVRLQVR